MCNFSRNKHKHGFNVITMSENTRNASFDNTVSHGILKSQKIANPVNLIKISITFLVVDRRAVLLW